MAKTILTNCRIMAGAYELHKEANTVELDHKVGEIHDTTTFDDEGAKDKTPGMEETSATCEGFWPTDDRDLDAGLFGEVGLDDTPISISEDDDEGDQVYFMLGAISYSPGGGEVGQPHKWSADIGGKGKLILGQILKIGEITGGPTGGTAFELGAVSATQKLYAVCHVYEANGTNLAGAIQSDDLEGMGSPAARITFTAFTDVGAEMKEEDGAITDTWYRYYWTATGGTFKVFVAAGIK